MPRLKKRLPLQIKRRCKYKSIFCSQISERFPLYPECVRLHLVTEANGSLVLCIILDSYCLFLNKLVSVDLLSKKK